MSKLLASSVAAFALLATSLFAADVNGKWVGEMEGRDGQKRVQTFDFKVDGSTLTGTVSSPMGERKIEEGKVTGDDISFVLTIEINGETRKIQYSGKMVGEELKMKAGSGERMREFTAKRSTS
jgi:hypothetical protein